MTGFWYGFVLSSVVTILTAYVFSTFFLESVRRRQPAISWRHFFKAVKDPDFLTTINGQRLTTIVGVNDGIVPAAVLARNLGIDDLHYVVADFDRETQQCIRSTLDSLSFDMTNRGVLLLDDQILRGTTMHAAYQKLLSLPGASADRIVRAAVYRYVSPAARPPLDIEAPRTTSGRIKVAPWSFSLEHGKRYKTAAGRLTSRST